MGCLLGLAALGTLLWLGTLEHHSSDFQRSTDAGIQQEAGTTVRRICGVERRASAVVHIEPPSSKTLGAVARPVGKRLRAFIKLFNHFSQNFFYLNNDLMESCN